MRIINLLFYLNLLTGFSGSLVKTAFDDSYEKKYFTEDISNARRYFYSESKKLYYGSLYKGIYKHIIKKIKGEKLDNLLKSIDKFKNIVSSEETISLEMKNILQNLITKYIGNEHNVLKTVFLTNNKSQIDQTVKEIKDQTFESVSELEKLCNSNNHISRKTLQFYFNNKKTNLFLMIITSSFCIDITKAAAIFIEKHNTSIMDPFSTFKSEKVDFKYNFKLKKNFNFYNLCDLEEELYFVRIKENFEDLKIFNDKIDDLKNRIMRLNDLNSTKLEKLEITKNENHINHTDKINQDSNETRKVEILNLLDISIISFELSKLSEIFVDTTRILIHNGKYKKDLPVNIKSFYSRLCIKLNEIYSEILSLRKLVKNEKSGFERSWAMVNKKIFGIEQKNSDNVESKKILDKHKNLCIDFILKLPNLIENIFLEEILYVLIDIEEQGE